MVQARTSRGSIDRRTVAKGAAWSVPVIAVGAAAPAMAVSSSTPTGEALGACKLPGASCNNVFTKGYAFLVTVNGVAAGMRNTG